jgi:uncharacterized protein YdgA (DUF945 family)
LSAKQEYGVKRLEVGPEKIDHAFGRIGVSGLDAKAFEAFMKFYSDTMTPVLADIAAANKDPQKMNRIVQDKMTMIGTQLLAEGEKLLTKGLTLEISDVHVGLPEGDINGDVRIGLKQDMTVAKFIPLATNPELALDIFSLKSTISFPQALVSDAPTLFSPIYPGMQTGLFVKNGNMAEHSAEIKNGKLYLNGQEVVLRR